jgi:hypothetical protein
MTTSDNRNAQRAKERAARDRNRRLRHLALTTIADMAAADLTVSGATLLLPDGSIEYVDAAPLRKGGRA